MKFGQVSMALVIVLLGADRSFAAEDIDLASFDARIKPADRRHWAFQLVKIPAVPAIKDGTWARNPIDAFVLARLEARGWRPAPAASPQALLRRLYLALIGV